MTDAPSARDFRAAVELYRDELALDEWDEVETLRKQAARLENSVFLLSRTSGVRRPRPNKDWMAGSEAQNLADQALTATRVRMRAVLADLRERYPGIDPT
jgi:hypothetical protein